MAEKQEAVEEAVEEANKQADVADAESKEAEDVVQQQADDSESKEEPETGAKKF